MIQASHYGKEELVRIYLDYGAKVDNQAEVTLVVSYYRAIITFYTILERVDSTNGRNQDWQERHSQAFD